MNFSISVKFKHFSIYRQPFEVLTACSHEDEEEVEKKHKRMKRKSPIMFTHIH